MWRSWILFWRPGASSYAADIDLLFVGLLAISGAVLLLLLVLLITFAVRYRRGSDADRTHRIRKTWHWEVSWTVATLISSVLRARPGPAAVTAAAR